MIIQISEPKYLHAFGSCRVWATSRRDGVQTPQHLRTCEYALNVFFLIFHICARSSGPEAAVDILAKKAEVDVTVWSHR